MINNTDLSSLRRNYSLQRFDESTVEVNPFQQFSKWMEEALKSDLLDPTGMALGTANKDGIPAVRMVLLKGFDENGFVFFTNYESHKGSDLINNPNASILFYDNLKQLHYYFAQDIGNIQMRCRPLLQPEPLIQLFALKLHQRKQNFLRKLE